MTNKKERIYFENLDVIRFLAAFMIIIYHSYSSWVGWYGKIRITAVSPDGNFTTFGKFLDQLVRNLGIGVDIFFLLSGFLITYILLEEKKRTRKIRIDKFIIRRTLRIWPLYFLLIAIAPLLVDWVDSEPPSYLMNALFLGNFNIIQTEKWLFPFSHFWTICVEEHFYLIWPFIIFLIPKKHLLPTFVFFILTSFGFRIYSAMTMVYPWFTIYLHTLSRLDVLVIGSIAAYFYSEKPIVFKIRPLFRILLLLLLIFSLSLEPVVLWQTAFSAAFKKYFYIGIISVLLLDYNFNPSFKHFLPNKSFIHYLGKVSYGIYMYGNIIVTIIMDKLIKEYEIRVGWIFFSIVISLSLIIPIISYELFEKPILKISKKFQVVKTRR
ncbi:MAG: hypothetical protein C0598_03540 [Marinilabiliales bacterium]|nr:MAG: hypothetical protein C0598_03540 [Marinilabiliales bacterium]